MSARPPSPEPPREGENEVQRNIRLKVCAYCKKPGARLKCNACRQRTYCDKRCQKSDWKTVHREQCEKLQQVFVPPPAGWREAKEAAERDGGGGGGAAAAAGGGAAGAAADDDAEFGHPCPICLDNEDDATVDGEMCGMCTACGQMYCGACNKACRIGRIDNCPTCRAPGSVSDKEHFRRLWKLIHDRSPGRHTLSAQNCLGEMYKKGQGVKQDYKEAVEWYRKAAEQGDATAQCNLGYMCNKGEGVKQDYKEAVEWYRKAAEQGFAKAQSSLGTMYKHGQGAKQDYNEAVMWYRQAAEQGCANAQCNLGRMYYEGQGVKQDHKQAIAWCRKAAEQGYAEAQCIVGVMYASGLGVPQDVAKALKWLQLAAEQGYGNALKTLDIMQQGNLFPTFPTPPPGTAVTTILLTSAAGAKHNNTPGTVVIPTDGAVVKPGRVAVLLEGAATPISFKLMNLRV